MPLPAEQVRAWLTRSCERQGVPVLVTDPAVLRTVGALLGLNARQLRRGAGRAHKASAVRAPRPHRGTAGPASEPPGGLDTVVLQATATGHSGGFDHDVVDECLDDGRLPADREGVPLLGQDVALA